MRWLPFFLLLTLILGVPAADAAPSRKKAIWGPAEVNGASQFPIYRELGVGIYQATVRWRDVAPTRPADPRDPDDPAYRWPVNLDRTISEAGRNGIRVSLLVLGTPAWANGGRDARWAPTDVNDYARFMEAAARRYPRVHMWMVWGEPTKESNFQPLGSRGPRIYARLLDAAYASLKAVSRGNLVIGGNTYTVGGIPPLRFIPQLRLPSGRPPRMDLYGHNPFSLRRPDLRSAPLGNGFADFSDLDTLARTLDSHFRRPLKLFLSEYSLPTDHRNSEFNFFLSRRVQAQWLGDALRIARHWPRIYTLGYLGLYDEAPNATGDEVRRGLIDARGRRKPAFDVFARG